MNTKWLFILGFVLVFGVAFAMFQYMVYDLPKLDSVEDYRPPLTSRVYDSENNLIAEFYTEKRTIIPIEKIPNHVKHAFLAAEDANFYNHTGLDYWGIFRAFLNEIKYRLIGGQRMGGSTITQQTAKTMLLSRQRTYTRKIKEFILSKRIEDSLEKDEILNLYLNQIYFGNGAYGIEQAAQTYYGISAKDLTLNQASSLASVPKSPNRINPLKNPKRVKSRRNYVLDQMVLHGFASSTAAQIAKSKPIKTKTTEFPYLNKAPYYTEEIRRMLIAQYGEDELYHGGLSIYAPINIKIQESAQKALKRGLRELDKRQGYRGPLARLDLGAQTKLNKILDEKREDLFKDKSNNIWNLSSITTAKLNQNFERTARSIKVLPLTKGAMVAGLVTDISNTDRTATISLGKKEATLPFSMMSWARPFNTEDATPKPQLPTDVLKTGDIVLVKIIRTSPKIVVSLQQIPLVEGAVAVIEPFNHRVLAMVGGYDFFLSSFNRATQAKRQPGSSFKPIIYAKALDEKIVTASTLITDAPKVYVDNEKNSQWKPRNDTGRFMGDITVHSCLVSSVNTCSITLLEKVGIDPVRSFAASVGELTEDNPLPRDLTLALGSGEVIPLNHFNAYTIFPNGGRYSPPVLIEKIVTSQGNILFEANTVEPTQVISPETAYIMTNTMRGLMNGSGKRITGISDPLAGKTGTTNDFRSAWFVGFSQDVVVGVYVGFDTNITLGAKEYGSRAALPLWGYLMKDTLSLIPAREFIEPQGVVWRLIDPKTGLLANQSMQHATKNHEHDEVSEENQQPSTTYSRKEPFLEVFIEGTEPTQSASDVGPPPLELYDIGGLRP